MRISQSRMGKARRDAHNPLLKVRHGGWRFTMDQRLVDEDLERVLQPLESANGLSNRHYTDPEWFEIEKQKLFFDNWAAIGFARDVSENGDAKPLTFLGQPLVIIRGRDGRLRVFQNICRHRGMILIGSPADPRRHPLPLPFMVLRSRRRAQGDAACRRSGPQCHEAIDRDSSGWSRCARMSGATLSSSTSPAMPRPSRKCTPRRLPAGGNSTAAIHSGDDSGFKLEVATNWKLAVENYCESYHLPWVHPGLNSYSRLEDHYHIEEPGAFSGQGTLVYRQLKGDEGETFRDMPGLAATWDTAAEYIALYPNLLLGVHRDHSFAIVLEPVGPRNTVEHVEIYYHTEEDTGPERAALRARNTALWKVVFEEDIFVVEGMQQGRNALYFDGGRFSPAMDGPTHMFHQWVAAQLSR
jgi:choline monooxygenase